MTGPLSGFRVIEMAGIGPAPFAGMMLSDMGAEVIRVDRAGKADLGIDMPRTANVSARGRRSLVLDLKSPAGIRALEKLAAKADALIEGFRPGVMERLGIGPDRLAEINPKLVFGRVSGWGQNGPLAAAAGHDINYIALTGMLNAVGPAGKPYPPLNLVGDYGGGAMFLAFGVVCALLEAQRSGKGQVVDAAMKVHTVLGPGLLESAYEVCLAHELRKRGLLVARQVSLPVVYDGVELDTGYRIDLLVENQIVVELKTVSKLLPIHEAQLLSHLRLGRYRVGLLINFHVARLKYGIRRLANGL